MNKIDLGSLPFAGYVVTSFEQSSSATRELIGKTGHLVIGCEDGRGMDLAVMMVSCIRGAESVPVTGCGDVGCADER